MAEFKFESDLIIDGELSITVPAIGGRENVFTATTSDGVNDVGLLANGTTTAARFIPTFVGYTEGGYQTLLFRGLGPVADDLIGSSPFVQFLAANTDSASDPNNGTLTVPSARTLFTWGSTSTYMTMFAGGDITFTETITIDTIIAGIADYDKFLVSDAGEIKFRTGAELLSDIGAQASGDFLTAAIADTKSVGDLTFSDGVALRFGAGSDMFLHSSGAASWLTLDTGDFTIRDWNAASPLARFTFGRTTGNLDATSYTGDGSTLSNVGRKVFQTTNTGASDNNKWTKVMSTTISTIFNDETYILHATSSESSATESKNHKLSFRVKQQAAFGSDPLVEAWDSYDNVEGMDVGYIIVQNTPTSIVEFYIRIPSTFSEVQGWIISEGSNDGATTWFSDQTYTTSPAGLVASTSVVNLNDANFDSEIGGDYLHAAASDIKTAGNLKFNDNIVLELGNSSRFNAYYDTTKTIFNLTAGDLVIQDTAALRFTFGRTTGDLTLTGDLIFPGASNIAKVNLWADDPRYGIGLISVCTYGGLGGAFAITNIMNNDNTRGFWWGDDAHTTAQGAMALTTDGELTVAKAIRVGFGETDTTSPGTYDLDVGGGIRFNGSSRFDATTIISDDNRIDFGTGNDVRTQFVSASNKFQAALYNGADYQITVNGGIGNALFIDNSNDGAIGIGNTPGNNRRLFVDMIHSSTNASEQFGTVIDTDFTLADTGLKQGIRINTRSTHTTGTQASLSSILNLTTGNGNGGTTTAAHGMWSRIDASTGHTVTNAYNFFINDSSVAGTITNLYGLYVKDLTAGATLNYAVYAAGSTKSYFGGNVGVGKTAAVAKLHVYQNDTEVTTSAGITVEQDGTGDARIGFSLTGGEQWAIGCDNSDGDSFKISNSNNLSSDYAVIIHATTHAMEFIDGGKKIITDDASTTHTVTTADRAVVRRFTGSSAITVTVDTGSLERIGETAEIDQYGTGLVTIAAGTATLRVNALLSLVSSGQYSRIAIQKMTSTEYRVFGELA